LASGISKYDKDFTVFWKLYRKFKK